MGSGPSIPDWTLSVSDEQIAGVRALPGLRHGRYGGIDARHALDFFARRFVRPIADFARIGPENVVADLGAGYGWLAMAFAVCTPARVIAVDTDAERLETGRAIASYLKIPARIEWRQGRLGDLPLADREADIGYCVEVLEHVGRDQKAVFDLGRVVRELLVLTTPNLLFPIVAHDTRLPLCHWLPMPLRSAYAAAFGRSKMQEGNLFWSPVSLARSLRGFERISSFLHYSSMSRYLEAFPCHLPYGPGADRYDPGPGLAKRGYYRLVSRFGGYSNWLMPSLAGVFRRLDP